MSLIERKDVIRYFVSKNEYKSYLEIGLYGSQRTFDHINCQEKDSVDPNPGCNAKFCMTSDQFFEYLDNGKLVKPSDFKWDIIFIDGDHYHETVDRDVPNALNHLSDGGTIVMHDCGYGEGITKANPRGTDVWKSWVKLRCTRPDLKMNVVNIDWGVGVIQRGDQEVWNDATLEECLTTKYFTSLVDQNSVNPLDSYNLSSDSQFIADGSWVDIVDDNLTRTKLLSLITVEDFYKIYE